MKTTADPRHHRRISMMKQLFSFSFGSQTPVTDELDTGEIDLVTKQLPDYDTLIHTAAPEWPLDQINKVDLAILRLAIHELTLKEVPHKVVIDEAVELAKEYGSEKSPKFINGVLGTVYSELTKDPSTS